ncbi:MAG: flagellar biosynthesis protein FliQ [Chitinispirillaceae bacterium]|nr:flagellar biosynthesis protein FliQ [Chitinispirillaceae bacterium]
MDPTVAIDIGRNALIVTLIISGPILLSGLFIGLLIGLFQAVTQIHEMTLTFIPKILVMVLVFLLLLPWMLLKLLDYTAGLFDLIPTVMK